MVHKAWCDAGRGRRRRLLHQPRHLRDAFRGGAGSRGGMRSVLGLFEGVATGAADGYVRMNGTPASTLLHLGPGLANGLANIHNARSAHLGMVNIVGEHATYHMQLRPAADLRHRRPGAAVSHWVRPRRTPVRRRRRRRGDARTPRAARIRADRDLDPARRHLLARGRGIAPVDPAEAAARLRLERIEHGARGPCARASPQNLLIIPARR